MSRTRAHTDTRFSLGAIAPDETMGLAKEDAIAALAGVLEELRALQEQLYAQGEWSLLIVLQGMDAAGKDSLIEHVMAGINPQGCAVASFKAPSSEELAHTFLWRATSHLPRRGHIGIFNRSYYEDVVVVRVHPEWLAAARLPDVVHTPRLWQERFEDIVNFEQHLHRNGTVVLKFFLHISKEEQRRRLLARLDTPDKQWKVAPEDAAERDRWDDYMHAYQEMIRHTATQEAPWHVVPADHKWVTRLVVASTILEALRELDLSRPKPTPAEITARRRARARLQRE